MAKSCVIYVVRHGQSIHNRDGIVSGHGDPPLTQAGRQQAEETKHKLAKVRFDEVYSSDLQRAFHTAEIISGTPVVESKRVKELRERNFGQLDGQPSQHLHKLREEQSRVYDTLSPEQRWNHSLAPDIESDHDVSARFVDALEKIATDNLGKTVLVAAHGGTIRTMLIKLSYASPQELPSGAVDNAAYARLCYSGGYFTVEEVVGVTKTQAKTNSP